MIWTTRGAGDSEGENGGEIWKSDADLEKVCFFYSRARI